MRSSAAPGADDPLEQDACAPASSDSARLRWFIDEGERRNPATDLRVFTAGNRVEALVDGAEYFRRLLHELQATEAGDQVYFLDFRGDLDERLDGPGTEVGSVLAAASDRGVLVFGLLWRSHPRWLHQSEEANADFVRHVGGNNGQVLLDARTRRAGSHHQKLVVVRHVRDPHRDVAYVGGIDLGRSRRDDSAHRGDPQPMEFPAAYGDRPPWHDIQVEVRGPAVHDLEHTFRERWYGSSVLDVPSIARQLYDRAYHASAMTGVPLPEPVDDDAQQRGTQQVQVLRTYPARLRRYPFAPLGERGIAAAYHRAIPLARRLVYLEDQYFWSSGAAELLATAMHTNPELHVVAVVPRHPDNEGRMAVPGLLARERAVRTCRRAGGDRFHIYDLENDDGTPVYVHAKVMVIDDVWAIVGSDNLNRRSWTHDSELSVAVLDSARDTRHPLDPGGLGDGARRFARDLRIRLVGEHLGLSGAASDDMADPRSTIDALRRSAAALEDWHQRGRTGPRPAGHLRPHATTAVSGTSRAWASVLYRTMFDPDGRAWRDRLLRRS
jgi:phosphatidylserine/phosphatidylglycerophosphate/cardiolipin synthase-like enzyme